MKQENNQEKRRKELYSLLGQLPDRDRPISFEIISIEEKANYLLEKILLDLNGLEPVPGYFVKPKKCNQHLPVVIYNHANFGEYDMGKLEFVEGRKEIQFPPYAEALTQQGYAALCIDTWAFGERRGRTESEIFKEMLWNGQVMWGMMVYDSLRVIDYIVSREDVDNERIASMGMSMGSTMSWWLAALDTRIKVVVDIHCLTDYESLIDAGGLDYHGIYYYVPGLLKHFTSAQINSLIAPRPHLAIAGKYDPLTPLKGLVKINAELKEVYKKANASEAWKLSIYNTGHFETAAMRSEIMAFFKKWL